MADQERGRENEAEREWEPEWRKDGLIVQESSVQKRTIVEGKEAGERELKKKTGEKVGYNLKG